MWQRLLSPGFLLYIFQSFLLLDLLSTWVLSNATGWKLCTLFPAWPLNCHEWWSVCSLLHLHIREQRGHKTEKAQIPESLVGDEMPKWVTWPSLNCDRNKICFYWVNPWDLEVVTAAESNLSWPTRPLQLYHSLLLPFGKPQSLWASVFPVGKMKGFTKNDLWNPSNVKSLCIFLFPA